MKSLHIVNRPTALPACLEVADPGDTILLIEDGVYAGTADIGRKLLVIEADAQARGVIGRLSASADPIDYPAFVALVVDHQPIVSWR